MMKKFIAVVAVLAFACMSSMAFAADISVSGQMDIRSRNFSNMDMDKNAADSKTYSNVDTQERVRLEINAKAEGASGKIAIENDWDTWGRNESYQANGVTASNDGTAFLKLREAWMNFPVPGVTGVGVKAGHQLLMLSNGWFYRAMKYGSDAWVVYADPNDQLHLGFVNVKVGEGDTAINHDDLDAYVLVGNYKISDTAKAGINITQIKDRAAGLTNAISGVVGRFANISSGGTYSTATAAIGSNGFEDGSLTNVSLFYNAKLGPVNLNTEIDYQDGKYKGKTGVAEDVKLAGNQIVIQGTMPMDPVTINFTAARGSGVKSSDNNKISQMVTLMDTDMHYTLLYEYKVSYKGAINGASHAAADDNLHFGFANTTALEAGVMANVSKSVAVGANFWYLQSTEKVAKYNATSADDTTNDLGTEIDVMLNWQISPALSWNWTAGLLKPGKGLGKDDAQGVQGVLSLKF